MVAKLGTKVGSWLTVTKNSIKDSFENAIVECNAWFLVLLAVLLCIAFTIFAALLIWCVVYKDRSFSGNWEWGQNHTKVWAECK